MEVLMFLILAVLVWIALGLRKLIRQQKDLSDRWATGVDLLLAPKDRPIVRGEPVRYPFSYMNDLESPRTVLDQLGQQVEQVCFIQEDIKELLSAISSSKQTTSKTTPLDSI